MPEIKNTFLQGKMNKDLDERLVPNGQYRDAWNIEVSTSEGSDVGTVQNILGNKRVEDIIPNGFKCVGSIANEKTNKLYWFISSYEKDAIIEHDIVNDKIDPVIVDLNAANSKAVLKFSGNIITGINIIDNLLFWTDNNSEPKKINIDECKKGTPKYDSNGVALNTHTQLIFENGSFDAITLKYVGGDSTSVSFDTESSPKTGRYFWFEQKHIEQILVGSEGQTLEWDASNFSSPYEIYQIRHYRNGKFLGKKRIKIWNTGNGTHGRFEPDASAGDSDWHVGDVIFGDDIKIDIEERHITVVKPKPLKAPTVKINHTQTLDSISSTTNLFETTFPRFSYRYKYRDGEFSAFAPFTEPVFNPRYTKDINNTSGTNVFYTKDNVYDAKDPHNKAMINSIHSIELTDFISSQTPEDAIEIEVLYKQENSSVIYSIDTIKQTDPEWHDWSNHEGTNIGLRKDDNDSNFQAIGGYIKGKYIVTTENIYAALPANQLLRPWDNVPRKALGQEITGNRIVYGNYLQNYNLGNIKPEIKVNYNNRKNKLGTFETKGLPSIKSQRNYQLGVIYCDKYGRETPVFTSKEGAVNIPWQNTDGTKNASKSLQLNASVPANFPDWVDSLKFFVKETSSPYYNLVMDRAWIAKSTYELDRGDHLWISFPSSDRNKISEEDYIILKKKIGTGEEQITFENKFKVIDIKNEAPDAIKYELVTWAAIHNYGNRLANHDVDGVNGGLFVNGHRRPDREIDTFWCNKDILAELGEANGQFEILGAVPVNEDQETPGEGPIKTKNLYASWRRLGGASNPDISSKKYKIVGGSLDSENYVLRLNTPVTKIDADIAHFSGASDGTVNTNNHLHPNLVFQIEKKELKDSEDFSGKFFVKISKNQITDILEQGSTTDILDNYIISAKTPTWYWQDGVGSNIAVDDSASGGYGLSNYDGYQQPHSTADDIQAAAQNVQGNLHPLQNNTPPYTGNLKVTDYAAAWDGIKTKFGNTFFVDSMHMVAGQSEASDYAKYCCVTWAGCTKGESTSKEISSWSYPPLKMWLTDWINSENIIETPSEDQTVSIITGTPLSVTKDRFYDAITDGIIDTIKQTEFIDFPDFPTVDNDFKKFTELLEGEKITGWAGSSQAVDRHTPTGGKTEISNNHVNGLEGIVTTTTTHSTGPRRWLSGITGSTTDYGVGTDTKTYSDNGEIGRHFMHLSFFAPGKDLHDGNWNSLLHVTESCQFGAGGFMGNLQGIWGGGVFTGGNSNYGANNLLSKSALGGGAIGYSSLPMEGNYDPITRKWLPETPGPGVGYGYDIRYRELHERQWDPTFCDDGDPENKIRDFIRNLHAGSQFKFSNDTSATPEVYTIKKVVVKKLYNHTSWRTPINIYRDSGDYHNAPEDVIYQSVEEAALTWLNSVPDENIAPGINGSDELLGQAAYWNSGRGLSHRIVDFGKASNRRLCYIIELDKNPEFSSFNPLGPGEMTADLTNSDFANIEFLEKVQSPLLAGLNKFPAIWEVDPKKQEVDLDIYYEASSHFPVKLNKNTNELIAPIGCSVEMISASFTGASTLLSWDGNKAFFEPGFPVGDDINEIDYSGTRFKFVKEDGSFVIITADEQQLLGESTSSTVLKTSFIFRHDIGDNIHAGLAWHNCFSFGNGLESNRIKDDFNEPFITNGVKASTTIQETYEEERRKHGLIYSGIYNSNSGVNDLNQFVMAEKITKDLNPTYGSIQKLFSRNTDLVTFCEDKVLKVLANKDAVFNADGNPQLTANENVLGQTIPFIGEYGIATNPESFASESYRAYFTDKQRGAVLRLSKDGLTPISNVGMNDWFRDNLQNYSSLIGSYDSYKEDYNITLSHRYGENFISNGYLPEGVELSTQAGSLLNHIANSAPSQGPEFEYAWQINNVLDASSPFEWNVTNHNLDSEVNITNHPAIAFDAYQSEIVANSVILTQETYDVYTTVTTTYTGMTFGTATATGTPTTTVSGVAASYAGTGTVGTAAAQTTLAPVNYDHAIYQTIPSDDYGWFYAPSFVNNSAIDLFGTSASNYADTKRYSSISRYIVGSNSQGDKTSGDWVDETDPNAHSMFTATNNMYAWSGYNPSYFTNWDYTSGRTERYIVYPVTGNNNSYHNSWVSGTITRKKVSGNPYNGLFYGTVTGFGNNNLGDGSIIFDRPFQSNNASENSFVEFKNFGYNLTSLDGNNLLSQYNAAITPNGNHKHKEIFNGDEIHIQFDLTCYITNEYGYKYEGRHGNNYIAPKIELYDGGSPVPNDQVMNVNFSGFTVVWNGFSPSFVSVPTTPHADTDPANADPYTHIYSERDDLGSQFYVTEQATGNWYDESSGTYDSSGPGPHTQISRWNWKKNSTANFSSTSILPAAKNTMTHGGGTFTIRCGCSFKFVDPNQQNDDGSPLPGVQITQQKLISDLRIRVSNRRASPTTWGDGNALYNKLRHPLWEINTFRVKKGFGVVGPYTPETAGTFTQAVTTLAAGQSATYVPPQPNVPGADIPAWAEVLHTNNFGWTLEPQYGGPHPQTQFSSQNSNYYGPNFGKIQITEPLAPSGFYYVPQNYQAQPTLGNPNVAYNQYTTGTHVVQDNYLQVGPMQNNPAAVDLVWQLTTPWVVGNWYLVDIEFDQNFNSATGQGGSDGSFYVFGARDTGAVSPEVVGNISGNNPVYHHTLVSMTRTEYSPVQTVQRGIFKIDNNSYIANNVPVNSSYGTPQNEFRLRLYNFQNEGRVTKVIVKKLDVPATASTATSWTHTTDILTHSFSQKKIYYKNNKLVWDVPAGSQYWWAQDFGTPTTFTAPQVTPGGWKLKFTLGDNEDYYNDGDPNNNFLGSLNGYMFNAIGDAVDGSGGADGIEFSGLQDAGDYEIFFNMDGIAANNYINHKAIGVTTYSLYSSYTLTPSTQPAVPSSIIPGRILFESSSSNGLRAAISNMSLVDQTAIFQGGTSGAWNWNGFNTSANSYISWDVAGEKVWFGQFSDPDGDGEVDYLYPSAFIDGCPFVDPASTAAFKTPISANQWVDRTINRYETYEVSFIHGIEQGELDIYYFNSEGYGFRIQNIKSSTLSDGTPFQVTIGALGDGEGFQGGDVAISGTKWRSEKRPSIHAAGQQYEPELQETFVITPSAFDENGVDITATNLVAGWMDNIAMVRVYTTEANEDAFKEKTITFSEDVNGWTSFKTFVPENGISLSKKYFTFDEAKLYKHYVPLKYNWDTSEWQDCIIDDAENYNVFYDRVNISESTTSLTLFGEPQRHISTHLGFEAIGYGAESKIKFVLNNEPSVVKTFNTLNYEGTQAFVKVPAHQDFLTLSNAEAYKNQMDLDGWTCEEIKSDLEVGSVLEFIKKEGKWFNYIRGKWTDETLNTNRFSVQGIGTIDAPPSSD